MTVTEDDMLEEHYYGLSDWEIAVLMAVGDEPISRERLDAVLGLWARAYKEPKAEEGSE